MNLIPKEEKDRIDLICNQYKIRNYSINPDGSIDVNGNVKLYSEKLLELPLRFGKVSGNFLCSDNKLTTLLGSPHTVGGNFSFQYNLLTSLVGSPNSVGGDFSCSYNRLNTTYSGDVDIEISGECYFNINKLPVMMLYNMGHINLILKYQRHFEIWNDDLSFNAEKYKDLISEINDGLL